jgi:hypothetical protein
MLPIWLFALQTCNAMPQQRTLTCPASPIPSPAIGPYVYEGCQNEVKNARTLNLGSLVDFTGMTVEKCEAYCSGLGHPLFGLEYSSECYCGTYFVYNSTTANEHDCTMPCVGDSTETCGGPSLLSVYAWSNYTQPSIPHIVNGYEYSGCYIEAAHNNRALTGATLVDYVGMTVEKCAAFCSEGSFTIFGLEYSGECYCGNSMASTSTVSPAGDSDCKDTCPGDYTQLACGDALRLSVYKLSA